MNMTDKKKSNNNYPISVNAQQCIGPCYHSYTKIIHPMTLDEIKSIDHNFCPVNTFVYTHPNTNKSELSIIDKCTVPTARDTQMDDAFIDNLIAPQFHFSSDYFVKVYYKISNLEELLIWLDLHRSDPFKTKERVFNNSMVVYGKYLNIIDHRMIQYINDLMIENLPKLYRHLKQYIILKEDIVIIIDPDTDDARDKSNRSNNISNRVENEKKNDELDRSITDQDTHINIPIIRSYIKEKFLGSDNMHQFMSKMIRYYKEDITNRYMSDILVNHMIEYIIKRIKITLEQNHDLDTSKHI
jgi:hypothetical protein